MTDYRQEAEKKAQKKSQSNEVSFLVQDLLNHNLNATPSHSFQLQHPLHNTSTYSVGGLTGNKRKDSQRTPVANGMDRSWIGRQDKEGILIYCGELSRQIESKNQELMRSMKECSHYKAIVDLRIQELTQDGANPLAGIVEQLQKERQELKEELVEITGSEIYIKEEFSRLEQINSNQERVIQEMEAALENKEKQIIELSSKLECNEDKTNRFKSEINNMQDIYDTKEKLQQQLENRIQVLEQENEHLINKIDEVQDNYQLNLESLQDEKSKFAEENENLQIIREVISQTFEQTNEFIRNYQKNNKIKVNNLSSIALPDFDKLLNTFDIQVLQNDEVEAIKFLHNSLITLFQQVDFGTNSILRLEEEAEVQRDKIDELQKDLIESVNIAQILKDKEIKMLKEIQSTKMSQWEDKNAIHQSVLQEKGLIEEQQFQRQNYKAISSQLQTAQEEVDSLRDELQARDSLAQAKEQQERFLQEELQEVRLEAERYKIGKDVYSNVLFKLCHVLPHAELEQLMREFISNSEQLFNAQKEQQEQQELLQQSESELKRQIQEDTVNSRQIIPKRKTVEQIRENLKVLVQRCRKLRDRENHILSELDVIVSTHRNKAEKFTSLEKELLKTKSKLEYEQRQREATTSRLGTLAAKESMVQIPYQGFYSQEIDGLKNANYKFNDKENDREDDDDDELQSIERMKNSQLKQSQFISSSNTPNNNNNNNTNLYTQESTFNNHNKDKIINNLLTSNYNLRNNINTLKQSHSTQHFNMNNTNQYTYNQKYQPQTTANKNSLLCMKLQDKLEHSKRNLIVNQKQSFA